jgi:hypothetical protein
MGCGWGQLMAFIVVQRSDDMRSVVEDEIRRLYLDRFAARLSSFPDTLVAEVDASGIIECAAGIRFGSQKLFSECYLDLPVERILSHRFGRAVHRDRVVEVCTLAATKSGRSHSFIQRIVEFAESADAEWAIFTATRTVRALLQRSGMKMVELARAERSRVNNPSDWGNYYKHDPRVMAVSRDMAFGHKRPGSAFNQSGLVADA